MMPDGMSIKKGHQVSDIEAEAALLCAKEELKPSDPHAGYEGRGNYLSGRQLYCKLCFLLNLCN
jgi:hypothetical protein